MSRNSSSAGSSRSKLDSECSFGNSRISLAMLARERRELARPLARKDIFYSGSVTNLPEYQSQKSLANYRLSVVSLPRLAVEAGEMPPPELCPCCTLSPTMKLTLATMMDFSLLKDPVFMAVCVSSFFGFAALYVPFVYVVDLANKQGIEPSLSALLLSIVGIVNTLGRVVCGYLADLPQVNSLLVNNICLVLGAVSVMAMPLCSNFISFVIASSVFGVAISGYISLTSIILVDLLGLDKLTNAFGLLILFRGLAACIGSPLAGIVYDSVGSYMAPFLMAGSFFLIAAISSFSVPCLRGFQPAPPQHSDAISVDDYLSPISETEEEYDEGGIQMGARRLSETGPVHVM